MTQPAVEPMKPPHPWPRGLALVAYVVVAIGTAVAFLFAGFVVLLLILFPRSGGELSLLLVKVVAPIGWLGIAVVTLLWFLQGRWRFVLGPTAMVAWLALLISAANRLAPINIGY